MTADRCGFDSRRSRAAPFPLLVHLVKEWSLTSHPTSSDLSRRSSEWHRVSPWWEPSSFSSPLYHPRASANPSTVWYSRPHGETPCVTLRPCCRSPAFVPDRHRICVNSRDFLFRCKMLPFLAGRNHIDSAKVHTGRCVLELGHGHQCVHDLVQELQGRATQSVGMEVSPLLLRGALCDCHGLPLHRNSVTRQGVRACGGEHNIAMIWPLQPCEK